MKKYLVLFIAVALFFSANSVQARGCSWWVPTAIIGGVAVISSGLNAIACSGNCQPAYYVEPAPVYYQSSPVYYAGPTYYPSSTVVFVEGGGYGHGGHHENHGYNGGGHNNPWQPQFSGGGHR